MSIIYSVSEEPPPSHGVSDAAASPATRAHPSPEDPAQDRRESSKSLLDRIANVFHPHELQSQDELLEAIRGAHGRDLLDADSLRMIEGVFSVDSKAPDALKVRDVMVPRAKMVFLSIDDDFDTVVNTVIESGHSRFPVFGENRDHVEGVLLAKDLLPGLRQREGEIDLKSLLRPAVIAPDSKRLNLMLAEFRKNRNHMAIVKDEYAGVAGLVTIEDVLETIVGRIKDEHDREEEVLIRSLGERRHMVQALTPIAYFNKTLGTKFSDDEYDTIGGLVISQFGRVPAPSESVELGGFVLRVLSADSRRLLTLQATPVGVDEL